MVALAIIMIAILGPVSVAVSSSSYARDTKDNFTAVYLAQEAIELLRHKRDGMFLSCLNANCTLGNDNGLGFIESSKESAWKQFKNDIALTNCFSSNLCAYDMKSFLAGNIYQYKNNSLHQCDNLYRDDTENNTTTNFMYLCNANGLSFTNTRFSRSVKLEKVFPVGANIYNQTYEDDVRVTVDVAYPKNNGMIKTVEVVDFIHSKS